VERTVRVDADPQVVWDVLVDIERWPEWTPSVTAVERLDEGPLAVGSRVRLHQPRLAALVWEVTELDAPRAFGWQATGGAVTTLATHLIRPRDDGRVDVTLGITQRGWLAPLVDLFTGTRTRRYLLWESQGLKRRSELL
jgi:uncharacterized membrane protein